MHESLEDGCMKLGSGIGATAPPPPETDRRVTVGKVGSTRRCMWAPGWRAWAHAPHQRRYAQPAVGTNAFCMLGPLGKMHRTSCAISLRRAAPAARQRGGGSWRRSGVLAGPGRCAALCLLPVVQVFYGPFFVYNSCCSSVEASVGAGHAGFAAPARGPEAVSALRQVYSSP